MSSKAWMAGIVVAVIYWLLGGLFYAWLMKDWFAAQSPMPSTMEPNMIVISLMCLMYGLLMAYTYPIGYRGGPSVKEGMRFGILFALIVNGPSGLAMVAMGQWSWAGVIVGWIWEIVVGAVLGIILAKIMGSAMKAA